MTHLQIIDDQVQVVTDAHEVLYLNLHLVDHVMERGDVVLTRKDITLQFFDLVIENEFKLLKLLCLLLQLYYPSIFILYGGTS